MKAYASALLDRFMADYHAPYYRNKIMMFHGVDDLDVYNITAPFMSAGRIVLAGRVEPRASEYSQIIFFEEIDGAWSPILGSKRYDLQDPFFTIVAGELILGGVEVTPHPEKADELIWRTKFLKGKDIFSLEEWQYGPIGMKDLRLKELANGKVVLFTRPQGAKGGHGKIGFTLLDHLSDFSIERIYEAPLLDLFYDEEWGGVNEAHLLLNGSVGILGHIARFSENGHRHYYPVVAEMNPITGACSPLQIIMKRSLLLPGESKREDLFDVIFSGGLVRHSNGLATLYAGVGDALAYEITLPDPFLLYESK